MDFQLVNRSDTVLREDWIFQAEDKPLFARALEKIGWARTLPSRLSKSLQTQAWIFYRLATNENGTSYPTPMKHLWGIALRKALGTYC